MLPVQIYQSSVNPGSPIYLLVVLMFFCGTAFGYVGIYMTCFHSTVLYQGYNIFAQFNDPDEMPFALSVVLFPLL